MAQHHHDAGASLPDQALIVTLSDFGHFIFFTGTRADLEAEGLIPDGLTWPRSFGALRWSAGGFDFDLRRTRPTWLAKRSPDCDWWVLRRDWRDCRRAAALQLRRATEALADAIYRQTPTGRAALTRSAARLAEACADRTLQDFLDHARPAKRRPAMNHTATVTNTRAGENA